MAIIEKTVFISYRRTNFPWAMSIYQYLTYHGFDVFFDHKSIPSGSYEQVINENIKARAHFLVLLTPSALDNQGRRVDWLKKEIRLALENQRNIIPIMLEGFDFGSPKTKEFLTEDIIALKEYQGLRLIADYYDEGLDRLCQRYLNISLEAVSHPVSEPVRQITAAQQRAASVAPKVTMETLTAQEWFEKGFQATDHNEKIRCYTQATKLNPEFAHAYNNRGYSFTVLGGFERAIQDYDKAIELDPDYARAYLNRGLALRNLEQPHRAIQDYDRAIELDPDFIMAYSNRGNSYTTLGDYQRAIQDYDKAIELDPDFATAYSNRGLTYHDMGNYKRAIQDFDKAIELDPVFATAYLNRGNSYAAVDEHLLAIQDYDQAIQLRPDYAMAYSNRGNRYADLGDHQRTIQDYNQAIQHDPEYDSAYYNKACYLSLQKKVPEAVSVLREALLRDPEKYCRLIRADDDFDPIREDAAFINLLEEFCS